MIYQLFGISTFTTAAALGDNANASLEQPGKDLLRGVQVFNDDLINDSLDQLSTACESIDY